MPRSADGGWFALPPSALFPFMALTDGCSVLVVEPRVAELLYLVNVLSAAGFHVTAARNFAQAKSLLRSHTPTVLLTSVRLGDYNGIHLVLRGRAISPDLAAVVVSPTPDPVLQTDAENLGATFVQWPISERELIGAILQTVCRPKNSTLPIRPPYERRRNERREQQQPVGADRRRSERRRELPWLVPPASAEA